MYSNRYKPSKSRRIEFANTMNEIESFCEENGISHSKSWDSYYFVVRGTHYRVSNHSVEASNSAAYDVNGNQIRDLYHDGGRDRDTVYIHASKTRIREIYTDLKNGWSLDGRGNRKEFVNQ